ncbi:CNNM domain-containing protein [Botrimarina sp.]|uniref:CNNM domain-containing protein n=1 Tax=Botrimarina sp. TaxID=2795802 RepID=UPI0032ED7811
MDYSFELAVMAGLMAASAFFSGSEAALFSISRSERVAMAAGSDRDRRAAGLLKRPERLLTAILFWNLVVNLTYYALTEVVAGRLAGDKAISAWAPTVFTVVALVAVILLSEVIPKSLAVLRPRLLAGVVASPLAAATRAIDPIAPALQRISDVSARLLLPNLQPEPYMELEDLERAVEFRSGETLDSESLLLQERQVLQRLVELADATAADLMRPRRRCLVLRPPVSLADLEGKLEGVGEYVLITEPDSDEIATAVAINQLAWAPSDRIDLRAEPLAIVPWCATASETLNRLRGQGRQVAVVINELGETIGVLTLERLLDAVLRDGARHDPHDAHGARLVQTVDGAAWEATGATPLRRVAKWLKPWLSSAAPEAIGLFSDELAAARTRTVGGLLQERLERTALRGDRVEIGGLVWTVVDGADDPSVDEPILVRIEPLPAAAPPPEEAP